MIPVLYSEVAEEFESQGIGALTDAISCKVKTTLNGALELEMKYPVSGIRYNELQLLRIIKAVSEKGGTPQLFDIQKITRPINGVVTVSASHVSDRKRFIPILPYTAQNVTEALTSVRLFSAEYNPFQLETDKSTVANFKLSSPTSMGQVLGGMAGSILDVYGGEYEFDNFTIRLLNRRGADNGVTLRYGKNITSIEQEESIMSTITGICPFWTDLEGNSTILPGGVVESEYAQNYPFRRTTCVDFTMDFETQPTAEQLQAKAESYLSQNGIGVPAVGIDLSFEHLSDYPEYAEMQSIETVKLGDTVHVYFEPLNIEATARITQTDYDVLRDKYNKVRVGSIKASLSYTIQGLSDSMNNAETAVQQQIAQLPGLIIAEVDGVVDQTLADALAQGGSISDAIATATTGLIQTTDVNNLITQAVSDLVDAKTVNQWITEALSIFESNLQQYITYDPVNGLSIKAITEDGQQSPTYLNLMNNLLSFRYGETTPAWMSSDTFNINNLIVQIAASICGLIIQKVDVGNEVHIRIS